MSINPSVTPGACCSSVTHSANTKREKSVFINQTNNLDQSQRLLQVCDDILRILDAYRQADKARRHTRGVLLFRHPFRKHKNTPNTKSEKGVFINQTNNLDQSQRLLEICDDVLRIFNPHRQADKARRHTRGVLLS